MTSDYVPDEGIAKVGQAGITGMVGAVSGEIASPDVMIDAALHILAAWVASSQTKSTADERDADFEELEDLLPLYIHRIPSFSPGP
jgi:hypothetical protein